MITDRYILNDQHEPIPCENLFAWARWIENHENKIVKQEYFGETMVSTVFLGLDHSFSSSAFPILFETMIFGGERDGYQERCSTWAEAEEMHRQAVTLVQSLPSVSG